MSHIKGTTSRCFR